MASALTVLVLALAGSLLAGCLPTKEPSYPKPNISLSPSGGVTPGGAVTIRCECRCRGARVLLIKAGDPNARRSMDPMGDVAEFPIRSVSRRAAGNYSCQYSTTLDSPVWSEPSDPVELVVTGKGPALRQSRESEAAATVYALVGERKQLDVMPQEPDPGAEGLTYAELDGRALQGKRGGPAPTPEPSQPSEYAAINVNWEPHGQSPRGCKGTSHPPTPIA